MVTQEHRKVVDDYLVRFLTGGESDAMSGHLGEGFGIYLEDAAEPPASFDEVLRGWRLSRGAFPDLRVTPDRYFGDADNVVVTWVMTGTHTGNPLFGIEPQGRTFAVRGAHIFTFDDDKLVGLWNLRPLAEILRQLGAEWSVPERRVE